MIFDIGNWLVFTVFQPLFPFFFRFFVVIRKIFKAANASANWPLTKWTTNSMKPMTNPARPSLLALSGTLGAALLSACSLAPTYQRPPAPVAAAYPADTIGAKVKTSVALPLAAGARDAVDTGWREYFKLQRLAGTIHRQIGGLYRYFVTLALKCVSEQGWRSQSGHESQ